MLYCVTYFLTKLLRESPKIPYNILNFQVDFALHFRNLPCCKSIFRSHVSKLTKCF